MDSMEERHLSQNRRLYLKWSRHRWHAIFCDHLSATRVGSSSRSIRSNSSLAGEPVFALAVAAVRRFTSDRILERRSPPGAQPPDDSTPASPSCFRRPCSNNCRVSRTNPRQHALTRASIRFCRSSLERVRKKTVGIPRWTSRPLVAETAPLSGSLQRANTRPDLGRFRKDARSAVPFLAAVPQRFASSSARPARRAAAFAEPSSHP